MPKVMISYRHVVGQREFAAALEKLLSAAGLETWLDVKDIPPLVSWQAEIFKGIVTSDYVVLCLSPDYFLSDVNLFECFVAQGYGKRLLPVIVPNDGRESVYRLLPMYEQTKGIENLYITDLSGEINTGQNDQSIVDPLLQAIANPTRSDAKYDVYMSFATSQTTFASRVAADLHAAGIKAFIRTDSIDTGVDWRRASSAALFRSTFHAVILSPDIDKGQFTVSEILTTTIKEDGHLLPILTEDFVNDEEAISTIRDTFQNSSIRSYLNDFQWFIPRGGYEAFIAELIEYINIHKPSPTYEVFVSYSRQDWDDFVSPLVDLLRTRGYDVWVDQHLIEGGDDWMDSIGAALDQCKALILVMSPEALASRFVKMEYRHFFNENKPMIPLLYRPVEKIPPELSITQHIDFTGDNVSAAFAQLFKVMESQFNTD